MEPCPFRRAFDVIARHESAPDDSQPLQFTCFQENVLQKELAELDAMGFSGEVIERTIE